MPAIQTAIEMFEQFTGVMYEIITCAGRATSAMCDLRESMSAGIDTSSFEKARDEISRVTAAIIEMNEALARRPSLDATPPAGGDRGGPTQSDSPPKPVDVPVHWENDRLEVFTSTGVDRFRQEVQSANNMLQQLSSTQDAIARQAFDTSLFPPGAFNDLNSMAVRIDIVRERIQQIEDNPVNCGTDTANAELEKMRSLLSNMLQEQAKLNDAMQDMDVSAANEAYLRLSQSVSKTEQYIRDNADEQGAFNDLIQEGESRSEKLNSAISKIVSFFTDKFDIGEIIDLVSDGMEAFNDQLDTERHLMSALANTMDDDHVSDYLLETSVTADTSGAVSEISNMQGDVDDVEITVGARTEALQAEFDSIVAKADEISSKGIYSGDSLIAGAAELSAYFTDTDAVEMMMGTLSDYAMGMENGVSGSDTSTMADRAADLGKIMEGSYGEMAEKGFEFTDAQKAIIEGTATQQQVAAVLGEEYLGMSEDMQAAAAITQVIEGSCAGLYETMSNTPQGRIIQLTSALEDIKTMVAGQLYPYILLFVDTISENWPTIQKVIDGLAGGLQNVMAVLCWLLEGAMNFASMIVDNWSIISPIIYGGAGALAVYYGWLLLTKVAELASVAAKGIHAVAIWATTGATLAEAAAQKGLNAAMYACPIVWIIILFIALIAIIFAVCSAIAKMTGIAGSGFGVMCGAINVVISFFDNLNHTVLNILFGIGNAISAVTTNIMIFFANAISDVQSHFYELLSTALSVVAGICEALNRLPFVELDHSGLTSAALDYADKAAEAAKSKQEYQDIGDAFKEGYGTYKTFQDGWASDAFDAGAAWGDGIADAIGDLDLAAMLGLDIGSEKDHEVSAEDYASMLGSSAVGSGVDDIAENTGAVRDSLDVNTEELKYLRDIAEQDAVNRFTMAEIKVDMSGMQNTVNSGEDIDGFMTRLTDSVNEAVDNMTEGVHQ